MYLCACVCLCVPVHVLGQAGAVTETIEEKGKQVEKTISNDNMQPFHRLVSSLACNQTSFYTKSLSHTHPYTHKKISTLST